MPTSAPFKLATLRSYHLAVLATLRTVLTTQCLVPLLLPGKFQSLLAEAMDVAEVEGSEQGGVHEVTCPYAPARPLSQVRY